MLQKSKNPELFGPLSPSFGPNNVIPIRVYLMGTYFSLPQVFRVRPPISACLENSKPFIEIRVFIGHVAIVLFILLLLYAP